MLTSRFVEINRDRSFVLELPFWLSLFFWSLVPATQTPMFTIESIPVDSKDIVLVAVACFYLLLPTISNSPSTTFRRPWHWHRHLPILTASLLIYAAVSVRGSRIDADNSKAMIYTLILTASAFSVGYNLIAKRSCESVRLFLWRLTVYLAAIGLLYSAASLFSFGLGDVRSGITQDSDFGILRVRGPLFGASNGFFILVPALGFSIQEFIHSRTQKLFKLTIVFSLLLAMIGLGSRAGLIILCIFFLLLIFFMKNKKQAVVAAILMIILTTTAAGLFFSKANTERFQSFEEEGRLNTHLTSFKIMEDRIAELNILGSGYGSYWSWYITDVEQASINDATPEIKNQFGYMLYHPHSTFLLFIVELGMVGLLYFLYLWTVLARLLLRNFQSATFSIFTCSVTASAFSMFFDFFIFKLTLINTLWWLFLFGALALNASESISSSQNTSLTDK